MMKENLYLQRPHEMRFALQVKMIPTTVRRTIFHVVSHFTRFLIKFFETTVSRI